VHFKKETEKMAVHVLDHPLIQHKLAVLRNKETPVKEFRELISEISGLMCYEATRNLPTQEVLVETPITTAKCRMLSGKKLAIVPVLRAGLGMVDSMVDLIPSAKIGHIGLYRDPETHEPVEYYCKLPEDIENRVTFVVDPMLATGGSAVAAIDFLKKHGCKNIIMMNIIGCPEGIQTVQKAHPDVEMYLAACDEKLNDHAYIVPGLGDAGDRIFGTK
jgi:uracil phosphoribosyltransferase